MSRSYLYMAKKGAMGFYFESQIITTYIFRTYMNIFYLPSVLVGRQLIGQFFPNPFHQQGCNSV